VISIEWLAHLGPALLDSLTAGVVLGTIGWLMREPITRWLLGRIDHSRNKELENLRAEIEKHRSENEFARSYVASGLGRVAELRASREFEAAAGLWSAVEENRKYVSLVEYLKPMKINGVNSRIEREPKLQEFARTIVDAAVKKDDTGFEADFNSDYLFHL